MFFQSDSCYDDNFSEFQFLKRSTTYNFGIDFDISSLPELMETQGVFTPTEKIQYQQPIESTQNYSFFSNKQIQQVSTQHQQYLKNINQQLIKKYESEDITLENQENDLNLGKKTMKLKKIKKQKCQKSEHLQKKLSTSKRNISQLWINRLLLFLKANIQSYHISSYQINSIKKLIVPNLTIKQLATILKKNQWIYPIIEKQQKNLLSSIYTSNLMDESKLILFETYDTFIEAIKNPENLKTWDRESKRIYKQSTEVYQRFREKTIPQICQLATQLYQKYKENYKSNKCSPHNNITHRWIKYFKDITVENYFVDQYSNRQAYAHLIEIFSQTPSIENIRKALKIDWFAKYIKRTKIDTNEIIKQIIMNPKVNLLSKMNMIISLPVIIDALEDPFSLEKWTK